MELEGDRLRIAWRGRNATVSLQSLTGPPDLQEGMLGPTLTVRTSEFGEASLKAANLHAARMFSQVLREGWLSFNRSALEREAPRLDRILDGIRELDNPGSYPAACELSPLLEDAHALEVSLLAKLPIEAFGPEAAARIATVRMFTANPRPARANGVAAFVATEIERWKEFFDTIESKPLTPEQRLSVVVEEDATLVLAGAGSGKTSVITAKASYLVKAGIRTPGEILLLAFARNAAQEMSERVQARSGEQMEARTFHALAYEIIGAVEGSKPALADHATDEVAFGYLVRQILKDLVGTQSVVARSVVDWFAHFLVEPKTEWDFQTKHEFYSHLERQDLRTLQGEKVKSYEELQIANWLYANGVSYEYEPVYEHRILNTGKRDYQPDFYLTESGIYLEHFGVRRQKMPDGSELLTTAPFVDRDDYLAAMAWKRQLHAEHRTTLVETFSYERQEGRLLTSLAEKLAPHVVLMPRAAEEIYDQVVKLKQVDDFTKLLGTFLRKFKGGSYNLADCRAKSERMGFGRRAYAFLDVFAPVLEEYERRLDGRIDFEDMILRAASYVETGSYVSPFRHILIDEFQDISQSRARLVKMLKAQHPDVRIFAVGDDWQSIFRFAGSDVHLMRRFGEEFGGTFDGETGIHRTVDLGRTFRSVDQIAFAAKAFVLRNPTQIRKEIVPSGMATEPAIRIVSVPRGEDGQKLTDVLAALSADVLMKAGSATVLLLGRYRFLSPDMDGLRRLFPRLQLTFKTMHASKGLEADHVILLKADGGRNGFPSQIADDPLLSLVSPEEEAFENAEERRVMYVAMTRARHTLTILASKARPSPFVLELTTQPGHGIAVSPDGETDVHACGTCGGRLLGVTAGDGRVRYRCEHVQYCGNLIPACTCCGTGLPRRGKDAADVRCSCGASQPACPDCEEGWLVERSGPYGRFLGCVRYPSCTGRSSLPSASNMSARRLRRAQVLEG